MPPNISSASNPFVKDKSTLNNILPVSKNDGNDSTTKGETLELVWVLIIFIGILHVASIFGIYLMLFSATLLTSVYAFFLAVIAGLGVTAGAHRLWTHKCYKAKLPLRILLIIFHTLAFESDVIAWSEDHRVHHKFSETDADPHNAKRGFFFSHVGWLLCKKHREYFEKAKTMDFSDLHEDSILKFQKKYYLPLTAVITFIIPTAIPVYFWNETWMNSFYVSAVLRIAFVLNVTWLVNSAAHLYGTKPYDKNIGPVENSSITALALGEGFHNYHHVFPWDYKASELGKYSTNITTAFLDLMARIGWAYDLKTVPMEMIQNRVERTGDGTHALWGWGDKDLSKEEMALFDNKED